MRSLPLIIVAASAIFSAACGNDLRVVRVYEGRIVPGPYVPSDAYSSYLKGVLAEEAGDLKTALASYEQVIRDDDEDPEPFTRIADVRCKLDPKANAASADEAFAQAFHIDKTYAPALAAQARCAAARGQSADAIALSERSAAEDGTNASMESLVVRLAAKRPDSAARDGRARDRAIALTLASGNDPVAWDALITWGRSKNDPELLARGLENLARVSPMRSAEAEAGALELLGNGQTALARRVAASLTDAPQELGLQGPRDATVARLAVDEALITSDEVRAERRAIRGHVPLAEVSARALILERPELAAKIARAVIAADPQSGGASMVLAAIASRSSGAKALGDLAPAPAPRKPASKEGPTDRAPAACVLVLAERLAAFGNIELARQWTARVSPAPMSAHDPVIGPLAVDLAARGVIAANGLPLELRLELAARRREPPPAMAAAGSASPSPSPSSSGNIDQKHMLLWHVLVDPLGAPARSLLSKLQNASERDPIIGFALARSAIASLNAPPKSDVWAPVQRALAASPAHPLLLAAAVDLAKKGGRAEDVPPAKTRLMAVARTPAERALASE